jgi:hypothetical protein
MIEVRTVFGNKDLKQFIYWPAALHKDHAKWVPPIYIDEWKYYNPKSNHAFSYCDTTLALCYKDGELAGRIMGSINHRYNKSKGEQNGRFSRFECINDQEVANSLLTYTEEWARTKGMNKLIGPYGMNYMDAEGFLIEGFEYAPTITTNYNFEYYLDFFQNYGYRTEEDYVVYKIDLPCKFPEVYYKIRERVMKNNSFELVEFKSKNELKLNARPILELMNECFNDIFGYSLLDKIEMDDIGSQYLSLLDPKFIKVIKKNEELVGFIIGMPHISDGIRKSKGKLFPFGILKIIADMKKSKQLDLLLGGVKMKYRGIGLEVVIGMSMIETAIAAGFTLLDSHNELVSNYKMRAEMERMGGIPYKKYRVYQKNL